MRTFRQLEEHKADCWYKEGEQCWWMPGETTTNYDRGGRKTRFGATWLLLRCNCSGCPATAILQVEQLLRGLPFGKRAARRGKGVGHG